MVKRHQCRAPKSGLSQSFGLENHHIRPASNTPPDNATATAQRMMNLCLR